MSEEKAILMQFKVGDVAAFDRIYHRYNKKLCNFASRLIKDYDTGVEIVQDVFVTLWERHEQVNTELNFNNYIFTITYNSIRKHFRNKSIETKVKDYLLSNSRGTMENTDGAIMYNELLDLANKTIEKLPPKRKLVYKLSREEGMRAKEIAAHLNISTRTAENHLAKALKFLEKELVGND
ncbi:MAG TPA: RNA polymerase sigma-70 factor [Chryseosolibacter sp.]|jgi:RNA polymerase sigma-70 factor (ECF subfamily)|nr:RNA polymerase sigma-70 factor [Chryseosolibacter sp.]